MRASPEHRLQVAVKRFLTLALPLEGSPDYVEWTANMAGVYMKGRTANTAKAAGLRRGWPDLQFLCADGVTRYIELKAEKGRLSPEQKAFAQLCAPHDIHAVCRSVDEVEAALRAWGVKLRTVQPHINDDTPDWFANTSAGLGHP